MKLKKLIIIIVLFVLLSTTTQAMLVNDVDKTVFEESIIETKTVSKWTVMYYMCGDNKGMYPYIDPLLENLTEIGSNEDLNIVTLTDRPDYGNSNIYFIAENGNKINLNNKLGWPEEVDTSNSNTFERFCIDITKEFPADHYAFITFADGGTGWQRYNFDDSEDLGLSTPDFAKSLKRITMSINHKIDVLFTSCCMSSIELAYEISPYVDYMVSTQEHITGYRLIQRYYLAVKDLGNNPDMNPEEFAKKAAENHVPQECPYWDSYGEEILHTIADRLNKSRFNGLHTVILKTSVAVLNLSRINNLFESMKNLSSYLLLSIEDDEIKETIKTARDNTRKYGRAATKNSIITFLYSTYPFKLLPSDIDHPINWIVIFLSWKTIGRFYKKLPLQMLAYDCRLDLYDFTELVSKNTENNYLKNLCYDVQNSLDETVVVIKKIDDDSSHGLNIYFPGKKNSYDKTCRGLNVPSLYENLKFSNDTYWDDFLKTYLNIL